MVVMIEKIFKIIFKVLALPFMVVAFCVSATRIVLRWTCYYLIYGGEFIPYACKNETQTIRNTYDELVKYNKLLEQISEREQ